MKEREEPEKQHQRNVVVAYAKNPDESSEWVCLLKCGHVAYVSCQSQSQVPAFVPCTQCYEQKIIAHTKSGRGRHRWLCLLNCGHMVYLIARKPSELPKTCPCAQCKAENQQGETQ